MNKHIKISFANTTPESCEAGDYSKTGWIDEEGIDCIPDEYDIEEGLTPAKKAIDILKKAGVCHPSSSCFFPGMWYTTESEIIDYQTGEQQERSFHLHGFTIEEEREIYNALTGKRG